MPKTTHTRAGTVAYEDIGAGAPVVLLHATLHDHHDFDPIIAPLARHHRVIAVDWPGHGASDRCVDVSAPLLADVLVDLFDALDLPPAALIGNSVGGYAAARLALDHPERVTGLILVNTGGFARRTLLTRAYFRALGSPVVARTLLPRIIEGYMRPATVSDQEVIGRAIARAATEDGRATYTSLWHSFADPRFDLTGRADAITAPTLVVWGDRDPVIPLRFGRLTHRLIPRSRLETLPTGHVVFSSAPQDFLLLAEPFLADCARAAAAEPPLPS